MSCTYLDRKSKGFTLPEILIALTIIGVVASMVVPLLIQNTQESELKVGWKKAFSNLSQVVVLMVADNNGSLKGLCASDLDHDCFKDAIKTYVKYAKDCNHDTTVGNCWHKDNNWKRLNGTSELSSNYTMGGANIGASLILSNGNLLYILYQSSTCTGPINTTGFNRCGAIYVDINGFKNPNIIGKDIFGAEILDDKVIPIGIPGSNANSLTCISQPNSGWSDATNYGWGCSNEVLK